MEIRDKLGKHYIQLQRIVEDYMGKQVIQTPRQDGLMESTRYFSILQEIIASQKTDYNGRFFTISLSHSSFCRRNCNKRHEMKMCEIIAWIPKYNKGVYVSGDIYTGVGEKLINYRSF